MIIELPWPDKRLSPNARLHWRPKADAKEIARNVGKTLTWAALGVGVREVRARFAKDGPIPLTITFYPPDNRHRDDDNMVGSFKSYRDGIADALGVNDRRFRPVYVFAEPCKPGRVEVTFLPTVENIPGTEMLPDSADSAMERERAGECVNTPPALTTNDEVTSHGS